MTQEDADQLYAWVQEMNVKQLKLLWKWIILEWASKTRL